MCFAKRYGDQMICGPCGLSWDITDPEPPECRKVDHRTRAVRQSAPPPAKLKGLPVTLPADLAIEMEIAHKNGGMPAAYRLLLDRIDL